MTWDLALTWFIMPAVVALILGAGGLWLAKQSASRSIRTSE
jgi:hypothetical protein